MSYKDRKNKKSKINRLKYQFGLAFNKFFYNIINIQKEKWKMGSIQIQNVMKVLRDKNRLVKPNNLKINEWVGNYLADCFLNGKTVNILTQYCLSKALEKRFCEQGNVFISTKKERRIIEEEIPKIMVLFAQNGFRLNWLITFNRSPIDSGLLLPEVECRYKEMVLSLAKNPLYQKNVLFLDWEDDFLGGRVKPDQAVLGDYFAYVDEAAFKLRLEQLTTWSRDEAGLDKTQAELKNDIIFEAACEAEEARMLSGPNSPFGQEDFILLPLEAAERYDSFTIFVEDFKKRVVSVLTPYPWRMKMEE